jgi:replication initiation and membrane attachment protein DnaB
MTQKRQLSDQISSNKYQKLPSTFAASASQINHRFHEQIQNLDWLLSSPLLS